MVEDKVVVVTGGAGLIGTAFIEGLLKNDMHAVIADNDEEKAKKEIKKLASIYPGKSVDFQVADITSKSSIDNMITQLDKKFGRIDAVINNAYPRNKKFGADFFDIEFDSFCENINLNLGGYFLVAQRFANYFKTQGKGNIINMSSIYGMMNPRYELYQGTSMSMPIEYAAIKSAINQLTKYMAHYFKGLGIRVNAISPGGVFDYQPETFLKAYKNHCNKKGMLDPKDLVGTMLYLISEDSQYVNGQNIIVDDGFSL